MRQGLAVAIGLFVGTTSLAGLDRATDQEKRPSLSLKATPAISFSPARIYFTAELKGGPDDFEEFYCPTVEWDWGDGTRSESTLDCDPYEAGRSVMQRRFTTEHIFRTSGSYRVQVRLKRKTKSLIGASMNVQVRAGVRDQIGGPPG